jgi:hypothetical protein
MERLSSRALRVFRGIEFLLLASLSQNTAVSLRDKNYGTAQWPTFCRVEEFITPGLWTRSLREIVNRFMMDGGEHRMSTACGVTGCRSPHLGEFLVERRRA